MSKMIKSIGKGIKKTFKAIKKVVKKITSSKVFKAIVIAAAIYFTAGAAAGFLAPTAGAAVGGAAGTLGATSSAAGSLGASLVASSSPGLMAAGIKTAGAVTSFATKAAAFATANPLVTSTAMKIGGDMVGGWSASRAQQQAYDEDKAEQQVNQTTPLNIGARLKERAALRETSRATASGTVQPIDPNQGMAAPTTPRSFYDEVSDTYRTV